jgi:LAO/AO transport system kinase
MRPFHVYMLQCADGSYYVGHTDELERRVLQHQAGEAPGYTHDRRPVTLVWQQETATREEALAAELQLKGWSRAKKEALIGGDWRRVQALARSKQGSARRASTSSARTGGESGASTGSARTEGKGGASTGSARTEEEGGASTGSARTEGEGGASKGSARTEGEGGASTSSARAEGEGGASTGSARTEDEGGASTEPARTESSVSPNHTSPFALSLSKGARVLSPGPVPVKDAMNLAQALLAPPGPAQRRALAKAITLLESTRPDHRAQADELLNAVLPHTGRSFRLGISGVPGVGKSTFIEALGLFLIERGQRVAVLAVDPSSSVSGGSILGDKTRMERLSMDERAFIRPSPAAGNLGGVAEKTREAMLVCEAAGHDIVIVETVGVGQSETAVAGMTDLFCLMQLPNAGDDLQAIKKGVMELADLVVVNKADLDEAAATRAQAQVTSALRLLGLHGHPERAAADAAWQPQVLRLSALQGQGLEDFWAVVGRFRHLQQASGRLAARRRAQDEAWMWERIDAGLRQRFRAHPAVRAALPGVLDDIRGARLAPSVAARRLLDLST